MAVLTEKHPDHHYFEATGLNMIGWESSRASRKTRIRRYVAFFGSEPVYLAIIWHELVKTGWINFAGRRPRPEHLLWAFIWLYCYCSENILAAKVGADEKTFREKVWFYVRGIAGLNEQFVCDVLPLC